jgi:7,8-dihydropterin-6-yl-methyl-4-(beta-D-ribofuranosyl)aminobenzene 5'-phosphate synthase
MAAPRPAPLDELRLLIVVDNLTDNLSSIDEGLPQVSETAQLAARLPAVREHQGHPCIVVDDHLCCACHGFSVLVTGRRGTETHTMLFDTGPFPEVWLGNAQKLNFDLAAIEGVFLSHWHYDHSGAFPKVIEAIAEARKRARQPAPWVDLHPDRPQQRGSQLSSGTLILHLPEPSFEVIQAAGGNVVKHSAAHLLCCGFLLGSGEIERVTAYEKGLVGHYSLRGDQFELDPLILDERFVAAEVRGRGVSVLSACSHAGVVNACLGAQQAFPGAPVDVVLGGYHLSGKAMETRIAATVRDLQERIRPRVVAPGHCTGWRAKAALAAALSPGRCGPSVVGSLYHLKPPAP